MTTIFKKVPSFLGVLSFVKGHQMVKLVIFAAIFSVLLQHSSSQHAPIFGSISLVWFLVQVRNFCRKIHLLRMASSLIQQQWQQQQRLARWLPFLLTSKKVGAQFFPFTSLCAVSSSPSTPHTKCRLQMAVYSILSTCLLVGDQHRTHANKESK